MENSNLIKGYITSIMGLVGVIAIVLHLSGVYEFPNPNFLGKEWEAGIGILVCFGLFRLPPNKIEELTGGLINTVIDIFKKKTDKL